MGPGFGHLSRQTELGVAPNAATGVHVQVADKLVNAGDRNLTYLDMGLPSGASRAPGHLKITVDGREAAWSLAGADADGPIRVHFDSRWVPQQSRTVVTDYELQPQFSDRGVVGATSNSFYIADQTALPAWLPPFGIFARASRYPLTRSIEVTTPAEARVLAAGSEGHPVRLGPSIRRVFSLRRPNEPAYVVAGAYREERVAIPGREVIFWTFEPVDEATARAAGARLASTVETFERAFGRLAKRDSPIYVVEVDAAAISSSASETYEGIRAASFPRGVLLDRLALARGLNSAPVLEAAEYELANIWFGWRAQPDSESRILLGRGIGLFAVALAAEARGGASARQEQVGRLLRAYDRARREAADGPLLNVPINAARGLQSADAYRAALFFVALEDLAGRDHFAEALRRFWTDMADQELSAGELRSVLEAATGRDLADVFHTWLDRSGIPNDFRMRYAPSLEVSRTMAASPYRNKNQF